MGQTSDRRISLATGCVPDCPGCPHRHLTAAQSLSRKKDWLKRRLAPWSDKISDVQGVAEPFRRGYRSKICLSAQFSNHRWEFGLKRRDAVISIPDCPVHQAVIRNVMGLLSQQLPPPPEFPLAYCAMTGDQVTLVLKSSQMPDMEWLSRDTARKLAQIGISGLWLHLHPSCGKKVFAKNAWHLVFGLPRSRDADGFVYGPRAFQQVMPTLYRDALTRAEDFLDPSQKDCILDLYCGIGVGLSRWTARCSRVLGVELDGEAVDCARINAPDAEILRGRCADRIPQMNAFAGASGEGNRLLYVNPPRLGLEPAITEWVMDSCRPARMAYLSCSAGTLRRDLEHLERSGYDILGILPYDFFPQTLHVETLTLLALKTD